jgi:hypothetical protein
MGACLDDRLLLPLKMLAYGVAPVLSSVEAPSDRERVQGGPLDADERSYIGLQNESRQEQDLLTKRKQWQMLTDQVQYILLHEALLDSF